MITLDVNGKKAPNALGKDIFVFIFNQNVNNFTLYPYGSKQFAGVYPYTLDNYEKYCNPKAASPVAVAVFQPGGSCTNWIIENHNMKYLH